jgi:hypothetical protein
VPRARILGGLVCLNDIRGLDGVFFFDGAVEHDRIPEPATMDLPGLGLVSLALCRKRL